MGAHRALALLLELLPGALVALTSFWEVRRSWACCHFLLLLVEKVRRVDEVPPFVCRQHLRMGRQGKDFGGHVLIRVRRWWRFPLMICMEIFRSVGKNLQCQRLVRARCGLHTQCDSDNDLMPGRCTIPHIRVFPNFLELQVYRG